MAKRIIFLSTTDPFSKGDWSGIPYFMFHSLRQHAEIEYLRGPSLRLWRRAGHYISRISSALTGRKYLFDYGLITAFLYGRYYTKRLKGRSGVDFIFVPAGLREVAFIKTSIPIMTGLDCSILQLVGYYPALRNVHPLSMREVRIVEKRALARTTCNFISSRWAADALLATLSGSKMVIAPFGANFEDVVPVIRRRTPPRRGDIRLLFVGVDWTRKGGDIALGIQRRLLAAGCNSHLIIVGCAPPRSAEIPPQVRVISAIDKGNPAHAELLADCYSTSHFLLLPTKADCTPVVICEAFAFGLPVLASRTGGIPEMIAHGATGYLLDDAKPESYVEKITMFLADGSNYESFSKAGVDVFNAAFNWRSWSAKVMDTAGSVINQTDAK